jgi:tellurite resistance protein
MVSGEIGAKELGKIIKILTLQQELLSETDEEAAKRPQQLEDNGARWEGF